MTREQKMQAVVEAARALEMAVACGDRMVHRPRQALLDALNALDAHTEAQGVAGETVDLRAVCLQAINDKLAAVPKPRSYVMAHYCMGLEDAAMAIQSKISVTLPLTPEGGR